MFTSENQPRVGGAKRGLKDLFYFCRYVCGLKDVGDLHREICVEAQAVLEKNQGMAIIIPRDHFKTTLASAMCLWMFTRAANEGNFEYTVLIDTSILDGAINQVNWIARQFEHNTIYRSLYGDFYGDGEGFSDRDIYVKQRRGAGIAREGNFHANAIHAESVGLHFDLAWFDDLIGERNYHTAGLRHKAIDHYEMQLNLLKPDAPRIYTATRWHDGDLTGKLLREEAELEKAGEPRSYHFFSRGVFGEVGQRDGDTTIFPERWPRAKLITEKKNKMSNFRWSSQFLNDPVIKEESLQFDRHTLYRRRSEFPQLKARYCTIDPNFREADKAAGDFAAFVIGGFDQFQNWWGLDVALETFGPDAFVKKLFEIREQFKPHLFRIERKWTSFLDLSIRMESQRRGVILPLVYIDRDQRSKETRWAILDPLFRAHRIHFADEITSRTKQEMEDEMERLGSALHNDFLDALSDQFSDADLVGAVGTDISPDDPVDGVKVRLPRDFSGFTIADLDEFPVEA